MNTVKKALTFSYDDGVTQDERLIEIFNRYGLKGTFNLNSGYLGKPGELVRESVRVNHTKIKAEDVKRIYEGHEVAVHTINHPILQDETDEEIIRQVEGDREALSKIVGYSVDGMAYPSKAPNERVVRVVKENTGVKYSRGTVTTLSFEPSAEMLNYQGTIYHHGQWDMLFETGRRFLELDAQTVQIMYVWGHSYEFDIYPERWKLFEEFCEMMSKKSDIFYGTNMQVFEKFGLI